MKKYSHRQRIVESSFSLPSMVLVVMLLWLTSPYDDVMTWISAALVIITTYVIVEWNNQCQLLRIRSRMNSVTFLAFVALFPALHSAAFHLVPPLCLLASYFILFRGYGVYRPQGYTFHGFLFLSLGSLFYPPLLLLALPLLVTSGVQLRLLTFKSLVAALLGIVLPYWLYGAAVVSLQYSGLDAGIDRDMLAAWGLPTLSWTPWTECASTALPDFSTLQQWQLAAFAFIVTLGGISVLRYVSSSYNDKLRVRQCFYAMLVQLPFLLFIAVWRPQDFAFTLPLLIFGATPFVAHCFALARGRVADFFFYFWCVLAVALTVVNYLGVL